MTESRPQHRTAGGTVNREADPTWDTTTLPRITEEPSVWPSEPRADDEHRGSGAGSSAESSSNPFSGLGSKLTAAGASAVAAATSAVGSARDAVRPGSPTEEVPQARVTPPTVTSPATGGYGAGASASDVRSATGTPRAAKSARGTRSTSRQPRKARLTLSHLNVYSVFKFSCVLAIALFFVWLIMIGVLYGILDVAGVLDQINKAVARISGADNPKTYVTGSMVFGSAIIIGAVYIVLFIALSTIGSMVYNLCADLVGGVEVTLSERE